MKTQINISITLAPDLVNHVKDMAAETGRTVSGYIGYLLSEDKRKVDTEKLLECTKLDSKQKEELKVLLDRLGL